MAYTNFGGGTSRPMVDVSSMNLTCADCGAPITQLPFQPTAGKPVYCRDCNRNRKGSSGFASRPQREMLDVSDLGLTCADCGTSITQLPFRPSSDKPVYCRDCNKKRRPARF